MIGPRPFFPMSHGTPRVDIRRTEKTEATYGVAKKSSGTARACRQAQTGQLTAKRSASRQQSALPTRCDLSNNAILTASLRKISHPSCGRQTVRAMPQQKCEGGRCPPLLKPTRGPDGNARHHSRNAPSFAEQAVVRERFISKAYVNKKSSGPISQTLVSSTTILTSENRIIASEPDCAMFSWA